MLERVFDDKADRNLWEKALDIAEQIVRSRLKDQTIVPRQERVSRGNKIIHTSVEIGNTVGYVLPTGRVGFAFEYNRDSRTRLAR